MKMKQVLFVIVLLMGTSVCAMQLAEAVALFAALHLANTPVNKKPEITLMHEFKAIEKNKRAVIKQPKKAMSKGKFKRK